MTIEIDSRRIREITPTSANNMRVTTREGDIYNVSAISLDHIESLAKLTMNIDAQIDNP